VEAGRILGGGENCRKTKNGEVRSIESLQRDDDEVRVRPRAGIRAETKFWGVVASLNLVERGNRSPEGNGGGDRWAKYGQKKETT